MVKFNKKRYSIEKSYFLQMLLDSWTITSNLAWFQQVSFIEENEDSNITQKLIRYDKW